MVRSMRSSRNVVAEKGLAWINLIELVQPLNCFIGLRRGQVPTGVAEIRSKGGSVAEEIWLPLARVSSDKSIEVVKPHAIRPEFESARLACHERGRIVGFAEPGGSKTILLKNSPDGCFIFWNYAVVTREASRLLRHHAESGRVMIPPGDKRRAGRRTQGCRMKICIAQPVLCY